MIILMGVAGTGKSTQGKLLADQKGYAWISSGDILRVLVTGTRRQQMLKGKLLSDKEMIQMFDKVLDLINPNDEFVLDGFPRTSAQVNWLIKETERGRFDRMLVIHLQASEKVVKQRLLNRGRQDDVEEAIAERFREYNKMTLPILKELKRHKATICEIDASKDPETIHKEIMGLVNEVQ